jgi:hypothetical protein
MTLLPEKTNNYIRVYDMLAMHGKPMHLNELAQRRLGRQLSAVSGVLHVLLGQKRVERLAPALYIAVPACGRSIAGAGTRIRSATCRAWAIAPIVRSMNPCGSRRLAFPAASAVLA